MGQRRYGQYCGLAQAADVLGERWTLLIVRDLLVGPKRFTDLRRGLGRVPTNILSARLKRLEAEGVVTRRVLPRPASSVVYELTAYGRDLEDAVLALGRWGARALGEPEPGETVTADSMIIALRAAFRPERATDHTVRFELHVADVVLTAEVKEGTLHLAEGPAAHADLVVRTGPAVRALLSGEITPARAVEDGQVLLHGDPGLLTTFTTLFQL
ncbi:winged helix-turn-helix transcriptional regulator [Saccharomonospora saliphila]|uniref:winged helix-turn-helix transcriptional regulator n=1 Tax=Saccharomonospora saliphila TaxID=369829 RepID=UPI00036B6F97|nr:winged helix-turn-helix transcriptional regulator [Saccharomonospora saliphila]